MVVFLVLSGVFFILGIVLLTGRGSFLIAGLNMASEEEKSRYNVPRICRAVGVFMTALGLLTAAAYGIGAFAETLFSGFMTVFGIVVVAGSVLLVILLNALSYFKRQ